MVCGTFQHPIEFTRSTRCLFPDQCSSLRNSIGHSFCREPASESAKQELTQSGRVYSSQSERPLLGRYHVEAVKSNCDRDPDDKCNPNGGRFKPGAKGSENEAAALSCRNRLAGAGDGCRIQPPGEEADRVLSADSTRGECNAIALPSSSGQVTPRLR